MLLIDYGSSGTIQAPAQRKSHPHGVSRELENLKNEAHFALEGLGERLTIDENVTGDARRWDFLRQHIQQAGLSAP